MKKKNYEHYGSYRAPKTTQEKRIYPEHKEYVRGKRTKRMLPGTWDDVKTTHWRMRKSWKVKRQKQYHVGGRGKRHDFFLDKTFREWELTKFFEHHNIPFRIKRIREKHRYISRWDGKEYTATFDVGYNITYWTDKEIIIPLRLLE